MRKASPTMIGGFVLGAIALAIFGVLLFGSGLFFTDTTKAILYFRGSVNGLVVGAPVKFKGVPIGQVSTIQLYFNKDGDSVAIPVLVALNRGKIATDLGREAELSPDNIRQLVDWGLRATLESQSLVTGLLFVGLDFKPDTPAVLMGDPDYPEIPTLPSTLEEFNQTLTEVLKEIRAVNFEKLMIGVSDTVEGLQRIVNSPQVEQTLANLDGALKALRSTLESIDHKIDPVANNLEEVSTEATAALNEMQVTLKSMQKTLDTAQSIIDPEAPLVYQLSRTLNDIGSAADALRNLASLLEQQPSSIIYGKERAGGKR